MSLKYFSYTQNAEDNYALENSEDLFVIRFLVPVEPMTVFYMYPELKSFEHRVSVKHSFYESCTHIYCISGDKPAEARKEIKDIVNQNKVSSIEYIGTVQVLKGTNIYQIYTGNLFIKFCKGVTESFIFSIRERFNLNHKLRLGFAENTFFWQVTKDVGKEIFDLCLDILKYSEVEFCHPEMVVEAQKDINYDNDYRVFDGEKNLWVFEKTKVFEAWKLTKGKGVKICVIDDGLDFAHPAFRASGKIISPLDMHDRTRSRLPRHQFDDKHGTAVASIAVSDDENALGIAPEAQLIPIRATSLGSVLQSEAFYWAVKADADIIVCSWGPPDGRITDPDDNLIDYPIPPHTDLAIRYAAQNGRKGKGSVIVFAAGNGSEPISFDKYASHPEVIGVGATNYIDQPTVYTDYGDPMFCCFPSGDYENVNGVFRKNGKAITVADILGAGGYSDAGYYQYFDGTSASCPGVAGVAALILSANPGLDRNQVKEIIKETSKKIGNPTDYTDGYSPRFGYGLVQAEEAVKKAIETKTIKTMKAVSLHIGINVVDKKFYGSNVPELEMCEFDMLRTLDLMKELGYEVNRPLVNSDATIDNILSSILELGNLAGKGGTLLISYSGHGAPLDSSEGTVDDDEAEDQAWVTYDGFLVDDRINECFSQLPEGLRVILISDSCFSGSISRFAKPGLRAKSIDKRQVKAILNRNNLTVQDLKMKGPIPVPKASIILLSASTDKQFAFEDDKGGLYTSAMLKTFGELKSTNRTSVNYEEFQRIILDKIKGSQQPQIVFTGTVNMSFRNEFPFTFGSSGPTPSKDDTKAEPETPTNTMTNITPPPPEPKKYTNLIIHNADGTTVSVNPDKLSNLNIGGQRSFTNSKASGETEWDKAYDLALSNGGFVEPDAASNVFQSIDEEQSRSPQEYLYTYPNPEEFNSPNRFIWHLDDDHTQLLRAREMVYPELNLGTKPDFDKQVSVAHIDTGHLVGSPILPENLQPGISVHIKDGQVFEGANDYDKIFSIAEQQAHGNATLALLAGGKVDISGLFIGYFGAIPFAKVFSVKISETVAILSGDNFASAVDYAIKQKCDVITMSMAGIPSKVMADAVNRAYEAGIVIVSAASNSFAKGLGQLLPKQTLYPARFDRVIGAVGAAINHAPYLIEYHQQRTRAAGGLFMQTCFGPEEALATSLAAYTPNITWFNGDHNKTEPLFIFTGGGTSSATPQIAAAAALYIQKYRSRIEKLAGPNKWKKAEIVRQALFQSARKIAEYEKIYGNGILRAADAIAKPEFEPEEISKQIDNNTITKAKEAKVTGGIFKRIFRLLTGRSIASNSADTSHIQDMLSLELLQLLHRDSNLTKYLGLIEDDEVVFSNLPQFVEDVKASKLASDFLLANLISTPIDNQPKSSSRGISSSGYNTYRVESKVGNYVISIQGIGSAIGSTQLNTKVEGNVLVDEISLDLTSSPARGNANDELLIINEDDKLGAAVLVEEVVDGQTVYQWCLPEEVKDDKSNARGLRAIDKLNVAIRVPIGIGNANAKGIGNFAKKIVLKVFKWLKGTATEKLAGEALTKFLGTLGDSKYELLEYDFDSNLWGNVKDTTNVADALLVMPGLFGTIEKGYDEFLENEIVRTALAARKVYGFNMPTLVQGIEENANNLLQMLQDKGLDKKISTIMTRSRGAIVARVLLEGKHLPDVKKLVMIAPPNQGTPMASSDKWSKLLNIVTNVAKLAFGTYMPVLPKILAVAKAIANQVVDLPGINDLEQESELLKKLNQKNLAVANYYVVVADYTPDSWLKKAFDKFAVDKFVFNNLQNDTVVPTAGAVFKLNNPGINLNASNYFLVGTADSVNHYSYLLAKNDAIVKWVLEKI